VIDTTGLLMFLAPLDFDCFLLFFFQVFFFVFFLNSFFFLLIRLESEVFVFERPRGSGDGMETKKKADIDTSISIYRYLDRPISIYRYLDTSIYIEWRVLRFYFLELRFYFFELRFYF